MPAAELRTRYTNGWTVRQRASTYTCDLSQVVEALDCHQSPTTTSTRFVDGGRNRRRHFEQPPRRPHIRAIAQRIQVARTPVREIIDEAGITRPLRRVNDSDITVGQLQLEYEAGTSLPELSKTYDLSPSIRKELRQVSTQFRADRDTPGAVSQNRRARSPAMDALRQALRQLRANAGSLGRQNLSDQVAATAVRLRAPAPSRNTLADALDGAYLPARNTVRLIDLSMGGDEAAFDNCGRSHEPSTSPGKQWLRTARART